MARTRRLFIVAAALALTAAACGEDDGDIRQSGDPVTTTAAETSEDGGDGGDGAAVTIVGENIAFDTTTLDATVGETLTITFDNRDDGTPHNLHVMGTSEGDVKTDVENGPVAQTLDVTFNEAGEVDYVCDVHPQQMTGTITVTQ